MKITATTTGGQFRHLALETTVRMQIGQATSCFSSLRQKIRTPKKKPQNLRRPQKSPGCSSSRSSILPFVVFFEHFISPSDYYPLAFSGFRERVEAEGQVSSSIRGRQWSALSGLGACNLTEELFVSVVSFSGGSACVLKFGFPYCKSLSQRSSLYVPALSFFFH